MNNFQIKKLTVLSEIQKKSYSCNFTNGMNLLIGKNKTGKSSIIKSIFYSFSSKVNFDDFWEKNVNEYIAEFSIFDTDYIIRRKKKNQRDSEYYIYSNNHLLGKYHNQDELSEKLGEIFKINFKFTSKTDSSKELFISPSVLFSYMYIDQHSGWSKIGEGLDDTQKYKNAREEIIKYIVGYLNSEYYSLENDRKNLEGELKALEKKYAIIDNFINNLKEQIPENHDEKIISKSKIHDNSIVKKLEKALRESFIIIEQLEKTKNNLYKNKQEIIQLNKIMKDLQLDIDFSRKLDEKIICPYCGVVHENSINNKISIVNNYEEAYELRKEKIKDDKNLNSILENLNLEKVTLENQIRNYNIEIKRNKKDFSMVQKYKNEGKFEIIVKSKNDLNKINEEIEEKKLKNILKKEAIDKLKDNKRRQTILDDIKSYFYDYSEKLSADTSNIKFKNFKPTHKSIDGSSGSEGTRLILAYFLSLYSLNIEREDFPFKFLIIDTPNQQGQDSENLEKIYSLLSEFSQTKGQIIIASERLTGFEDKVSKYINIGETKKNTLSEKYYNKHLEYLKALDEISGIQ
ncbi:hypothetical protein ACOXU5_00735 [Vagococcus fluvialis]|uniref:hypothetical protein n=1 Tax=Vagococcus fluvialis TaxID=2738 RepID=UPI003BF43786